MVRRNGREDGFRRLEITHPMQALDPRSNHSLGNVALPVAGNTNFGNHRQQRFFFFLGRDMYSRLFHITANISYRFCGANERYNLNLIIVFGAMGVGVIIMR